MRHTKLGLGIFAATMLIASSASAATTVGTTFSPGNGCGPGTFLQVTSPGSSYIVPSRGVITSWSHQAGSVPTQMRLKLGVPAGGNNFTIVGESAPEIMAPNQVTTFPTRISVNGGELLGFFFSGFGNCATASVAGYGHAAGAGDQPVGATAPYGMSPPPGPRLDVSAVLEPDADNDGFGDETQDLCPTSGSTQNDCAPPDTTITKGPGDKTKKKQATFEFTGTDSRAVASFACSLDGGAFAACTSPFSIKVKRGRHVFSVRAVDAAGNVDGSPATDDWKLKRKKRK